jgi:hypothetical protein
MSTCICMCITLHHGTLHDCWPIGLDSGGSVPRSLGRRCSGAHSREAGKSIKHSWDEAAAIVEDSPNPSTA